jgi:pimeloyl-ACP methyl ester carboxylesterase
MNSLRTTRPVLLTAIAAAITGLAGCGGDDNPTPARGSLIDTPFVVATLPKAAFNTNQLTGLAGGPAMCDVKVVSLNYVTIGVSGEQTNASGVMLVPFGTDCTAPTGLVAYAKGTDVEKPRTLANPADNETLLLAGIYAARGYTVVATDYLGFAKSNYSYHPYLHADSEASSVIDPIRAARNAASGVGSSLSGKVMLTGYSQGGHASMAAHRAIERDNAAEINVVAGAHLAGPYNLSGSLKSNAVIAGYQFFVPYLVTAWQKVYGTVYSKVGDAFKAPYDGYIETLLPSATLNYTTLVTSGKLPGGPGVTPTQARDAVFQSAFITDSQNNAASGLFLAGKKNDLLGWSPKSKLLLCGGAGDPTVPPVLHQIPMKADFDSRNLTNVSTVDVDALVRATYGSGGLAPTDPIAAAIYFGSYHGEYEPPFCHARAKALFDTVK